MVLERIKEFIDYKGLSIAAFERSIGMSNASFGKSLKNKGAIGSDKIENILFKYKELSAEWLLTGNGEMIKPSVSRVVMETTAIHQPRTFEKKEEMQVVYLYDFNASAGLRSLFDNTKQNIIDSIKIPNLPKCDGAIHIVGDSMYPLLKSGDIILYKQMPLDIENLLYGEMYLLSYDIDGEDYIVVKYVRKSGKGEPFITLGSENPEHAARDIDFRRVNALALVKASVRINSMK
jgi:transcriptional regulator|nr:MAG TPA: putative transcriptional regulator [Caudoviricetes sp.]